MQAFIDINFLLRNVFTVFYFYFFLGIFISPPYFFTDPLIIQECVVGPGMLVHTYNPRYSGGRYRRISVQEKPREISETLFQQPGMVTHSCIPGM
jgi:hypothetical protein